MGKGEKMQVHWKDKHPEELAKIKRWLGESEEKLATLEVVASDGLKGPGAQPEAAKTKERKW